MYNTRPAVMLAFSSGRSCPAAYMNCILLYIILTESNSHVVRLAHGGHQRREGPGAVYGVCVGVNRVFILGRPFTVHALIRFL